MAFLLVRQGLVGQKPGQPQRNAVVHKFVRPFVQGHRLSGGGCLVVLHHQSAPLRVPDQLFGRREDGDFFHPHLIEVALANAQDGALKCGAIAGYV